MLEHTVETYIEIENCITVYRPPPERMRESGKISDKRAVPLTDVDFEPSDRQLQTLLTSL